MAQIHGQIDSLKQIRSTLDVYGISRFNSINDLDEFLKNYKSEESQIYKEFENELATDITNLRKTITYDQETLKNVKNATLERLNIKIIANFNRIKNFKKEFINSPFEKYFWLLPLKLFELRLSYLRNNYDKALEKSTRSIENKIHTDHLLLKKYELHKDDEILSRSENKIKQLARIKDVVTELNPLVAGAIGENLVVNEIKKLPNDYILINDFSVRFNRPIYNKVKNDRIYSIQIDHLLISKAGIFILETKNWSKKSIASSKLRSPLEQINRSSYALFVLLQNNNFNLKKHIWGGKKKIPIRSVIVMVKNKPKEQFDFVKVKTIKELNSYVQFFEPIFDDRELNKICNELMTLN